MLYPDEGECVFFDSVDCLPCEEYAVGEEESVSCNLGYEIWLSEPQSVKERRGSFLRGMGLTDPANKVNMMGLDRIIGCSEAVSSSLVSSTYGVEERLFFCRRDLRGEGNSMVDELEQLELNNTNFALDGKNTGFSPSETESGEGEAQTHIREFENVNVNKKQKRRWWKCLTEKKVRRGTGIQEARKKSIAESCNFDRMKVRQNEKRSMDFSALYNVQEFQAHKGLIWTMKFSPDGRYLATGGEDGVVRIWCVTSADSTIKKFNLDSDCSPKVIDGKSIFRGKNSRKTPTFVPEKVFWIEELPLQELHGHTSDVLDLAWSNSMTLLSSSKDRTVWLWQVGCNKCLHVFNHNNYVTCIQFNPVDDNYFISGSIDGKVRTWGVSEKRVVDWVDVRDVVTSICYQPDGKGFAVGSLTGMCRFYKESEKHFQLESQICIQGRKKNLSNKITGIQFSREKYQRVMITSEDSKLRVYDGSNLLCKYRGLPKSGSQLSASFTKSSKHIISIGEDSRVYVWKYDGMCISSSKCTKSVYSCEHFSSDGVSVAIPWSRMGTEERSLDCDLQHRQANLEASSWNRDLDCFSLTNWLSGDGSCRSSATWPEEKLPPLPVTEEERRPPQYQQFHLHGNPHKPSETWGFVIVTAGLDGKIRAFHNYGLPVRF